MKKLLVAMLAVTLMAAPSLAANGGGKKKAKKKARVECKKDKCCDMPNCDPKCCDLQACSKTEKCTPTATCAGKK